MVEMRGVFVMVLLCGCGGTVVETSGPDASSDTSATDAAGDAASACARVCTERAAKRASDGYCEPMLVGGDAGFVACETFCTERTSTWTTAQRAAFDRCVLGDPLCFTTIDQCMTK